MAVSGVISFLNLRNLNVSIIPPQAIFAKSPVKLKVLARNKFFIEAFLLRLKILDSEIIVPHLKGESSYYATVTFNERGRQILENITVSSFFPFYFFKRSYFLSVNLETIVYPYPLKCDLSLIFSDKKIKEESNLSRDRGYEGELIGVRTYSSDPLKYIHWKATAKTSELKTKEFSPYLSIPITVDLDEFSGHLEERISKATYAILTLYRLGNPIGLKLGKQFFKPALGQSHLRKILYALAVYGKD